MWLFINDELKLLLLSNIITIAGHAWAILSSQTFQHQSESDIDHHTARMLGIFWSFPSWIQWTVIGETPQCHSFMDPQCPFDM